MIIFTGNILDMKKISFLLLFVLGLTTLSFAQSAWVKQKLDENLSASFPQLPLKTTKKGMEIYTIKGSDSIQYSAIATDYKVLANMDSAMLSPMKDTQAFADQILAGITTQKPNYTFGEITLGKWKTFTSYSFTGVDQTNKSKLTVRMIMIGHKMYTLSCLVPEKLQASTVDVFFNSVVLSR